MDKEEKNKLVAAACKIFSGLPMAEQNTVAAAVYNSTHKRYHDAGCPGKLTKAKLDKPAKAKAAKREKAKNGNIEETTSGELV